ncbi:hypothetical protein Agub_g828 [Astrephomene gubernaculifera]|uniref:ABC1 atypical kinase-like domain-containing protein n=1 Tax=Astrephomene gubernaculifera TaxID=47775 RepID=A0AAD3DEB2_9CHLO|nr:hypothetical protein Agub_g828 [Astrephomene gubernaculifera]
MQQTLRWTNRASASLHKQALRQSYLHVVARATTTTGGAAGGSRFGNYTTPRNGFGSTSSDPSAATTSASTSASGDSPSKRVAELRELVQEAIRVTLSTGPRGFFRAAQAAQSIAALAAEYLAQGSVDPPPVFLRKLFEKLGATYIKLGQFIASSPSLFPDEYVSEFQKCLDKTEPVPFAVIERIIEQELGAPWSSVFSSLDPTPLASASVAQVHAAVLRESGKKVVVKVLKPGVEDVLSTDLSFVYLTSRFLEWLQPELARLSLTGVLADMRASMMAEVDFTQEATHYQHFANFLDSRGFRNVATTPFVYRHLSTRRILVLERLSGAPLTDLAAVRAVTGGSRDPELVLVNALNTWFASVMAAETFHADVHAGNLLVLSDGRVAFIDFGIVGRISPVTWRAVEALIGSMATADYETMARALATIGACSAQVDFSAFSRDLEAFFAELQQLDSSLVVTAGGPLAARAGGGGGAQGQRGERGMERSGRGHILRHHYPAALPLWSSRSPPPHGCPGLVPNLPLATPTPTTPRHTNLARFQPLPPPPPAILPYSSIPSAPSAAPHHPAVRPGSAGGGGGGGGAGLSASLEVDQTQLNRLFVQLVRIGETHGVKFPREFGLFLKQMLYFDRYTRILAPSLQVFNDDRIRTRSIGVQYGGK